MKSTWKLSKRSSGRGGTCGPTTRCLTAAGLISISLLQGCRAEVPTLQIEASNCGTFIEDSPLCSDGPDSAYNDAKPLKTCIEYFKDKCRDGILRAELAYNAGNATSKCKNVVRTENDSYYGTTSYADMIGFDLSEGQKLQKLKKDVNAAHSEEAFTTVASFRLDKLEECPQHKIEIYTSNACDGPVLQHLEIARKADAGGEHIYYNYEGNVTDKGDFQIAPGDTFFLIKLHDGCELQLPRDGDRNLLIQLDLRYIQLGGALVIVPLLSALSLILYATSLL